VILPNSRSAHVTLPGRRPTNQDSTADVRFPDGRHLIAVADGMGGHQSGEVASAMAIEVLCREVGGGRPLSEALAIANAEIHDEASRDPSRAGMGTTLVALLRHGSAYEIANVGDSRAYRIDRQGIAQITRDHSFAAEAASSKVMSPEEIARSPWRNALTRSLGTQATVDVDLFGPFEIPGPPHLVLLCSDGMYRVIPDEAIRQKLLEAGDIGRAAAALSALALQNRSDDNVSVAAMEFGDMLATLREPRVPARRIDLPPVTPPTSVTGPHAALAFTALQNPAVHTPSVPRWLRKGIAAAFSDNALFALFVGILLLWLLLHLLARG
jgi:serine/threonine protein phosphatase PrpC